MTRVALISVIFALWSLSICRVYGGQDEYVRELENTSLTREEVDAYLTGKPLGYDKTAKLNRYPTPSQVLRLSKELRLTLPQFNRATMLNKKLRKYVIRTGRKIVLKESELDNLLREPSVDVKKMKTLVKEIAQLKGELRLTYLKTSVAQKNFITAQQLAIYHQYKSVTPQSALAFDE